MKILAPQTVIVSADETGNYLALSFWSFAITFGCAGSSALPCLTCLNIIERTIIMKPGALAAKTPHLMSLLNFSQCDHPIHQILWFWLCIHIKLNFLPEINFPTKKFHVLEHLRQCDTSNYKPYGGSRLSFWQTGHHNGPIHQYLHDQASSCIRSKGFATIA